MLSAIITGKKIIDTSEKNIGAKTSSCPVEGCLVKTILKRYKFFFRYLKIHFKIDSESYLKQIIEEEIESRLIDLKINH